MFEEGPYELLLRSISYDGLAEGRAPWHFSTQMNVGIGTYRFNRLSFDKIGLTNHRQPPEATLLPIMS